MKNSFSWGDGLPTLTTPRLLLRMLELRDIPALFAIFSDPEVTRYWSSPPLAGVSAAEKLLREIREHFERKTLFQWGVVRREDDIIVGTCTLFRLDLDHRRAEVGFALGRLHWGSGIMTEALTTLFAFAFDVLGLHRLEADADPRNERSLRCLERQGFRREGYLRERYHMAGEIQDAVILGLLRTEWRHTGALK